MGTSGSNLDLNIKTTGASEADKQLKSIATSVQNVAYSTKLSSDALRQIRSSLGETTKSSSDLAAAVQQVVSSLVGIQSSVDTLAELQGETNAFREKMADAAKEAAKLRQELAQQRKELAELKNAQNIINQAFTNPLQFAQTQLLAFTRTLGAVPAILAAVAVGMTAAAAGAYALVSAMGSDAREAENLANRLGLTTEQAMRLRSQAQLVEVNIHSVEFAARQLAGALEDPTGSGKKAADSLERIGVALKYVGGGARELGPVFLEVLERLAKVPHAAERVREAQIILGRSAKELEPLIVNYDKLKGAIEDLRLHMDKNTTGPLLEANLKVNSLTQSLKDLARQMAVKLTPVVVPITTLLTGMLTSGDPTEADLPEAAQAGIKYARKENPLNLKTPGPGNKADTTSEDAKTQGAAEFTRGKQMAADLMARYRKTADGMRDNLKELHAEREKLLHEIAEQEKYGAAPSKVQNNKSRLGEIQLEEERLNAALRPKLHDQVKERMVSIEHERTRLQLEVNRAYWEKLRADEEGEITDRADHLISLNDKLAADEVAEAREKISLLNKSDKDYSTRKASLELEIEKITSQAAQREIEIKTDAANRLEAIRERAENKQKEFFEKQEKASAAADAKMAEDEAKRLQKEAKVKEDREQNEKRHADRLVKIEEAKIEWEATIGLIGQKEKVKRLEELYRKQEEDDIEHIQRMIEIEKLNPLSDPTKLEKLEGELQQVQDRRKARTDKLEQDAMTDKVAKWNKGLDMISGALDQTVKGMVMRGEGFGIAWRKVVGNMVTDAEMAFIKMGLNWIKHQVAKVIVHQAANASIVGSDAAAAAASNAISFKQHMKDTFRLAKSTAIKAYNAMAEIPVIGPTVLGPLAAAASFAAIMALGAISAKSGAVLPNQNTMAFLHPREMVLPAYLSEGLQDMIAGGGTGGMGAQVMYAPTIHAMDRRGVRDVLDNNYKEFISFTRNMRRDGNV